MVKNLIIQININTINYFSGMFKNSLYYKKYLKPLLAEFPLKLIFSRQLDSICRSVHFPEAYVSDISKEIIISYILSYLVINIQIYLGYILNYYSELDADSINILLVVHILFGRTIFLTGVIAAQSQHRAAKVCLSQKISDVKKKDTATILSFRV